MSGALLARLGWTGLALAIAFLVFVPLGFHRYGLYILSQWAVMTIAAMGLNLTLGYAGQVSLAQGAFVGVGAYCAAILTTGGWPLPLAILLALVLCFAIGWLLGYPALRVQHHYLAFVTLAFSTLAFLVFRNEAWLTHGTEGIDGVPRPVVFGLSTKPHLLYYYFCLFVLALVTAAMLWLVRSPWGRAFVALRENPLRALSLGVDTRRYTLMAFAIGSALGGLAGTLYAPLVRSRRAARLHAGAVAQSADDGDRRRRRLFPRALPRRARRGAAARMAARDRGLLPDPLCAAGDGPA